MIYRTLGNSGLIVSALSLGTMQFGEAMNLGRLDQNATNAMVRFAIEHGINFIDTANVYSRGESETLVGSAIKGLRDDLVIATKARLPMHDTQFNRSGAHRVNLLRECENSLRRLQTDYIDLYQLHGWDSVTPIEETLRTMDDLVRSGKVRYIGISNYLAWQAMLALGLQERLNLEKFVTAQMYYSLVGRDLEHEFISFARYTGMGILVWSPLAGGFLSGKYRRDQQAETGTRFGEAGQFVVFEQQHGHDVVDVLRRVGERHGGASPARVALAWTLAQPMVSSVIIAARTHAHLADNIAAADMTLTPDDFAEIDAATNPGVPYPMWMVRQLDEAEDPRRKTLDPAPYERGEMWDDLRFRNKQAE